MLVYFHLKLKKLSKLLTFLKNDQEGALLRAMKKTKRLILRPLFLEDYENWRQAHSMLRPPQNAWDEGPWKGSELTKAKYKTHLRKIKSQIKAGTYDYAIFRKDDGLLIGRVTLMDISRGIFQNAYLGYQIFNKYWGEGYASEACRAVLEIAFEDLKLHRVEAGIAPDNKSSIRVAKAIGLRKEGLSLKRLFNRGKWVDMLIFAATCEDFGRKYKK